MASVISGDANVSAAEFGYLDGVTSALQTQLDAKLNLAGGKILQIVRDTDTTQRTTTSTTFVDVTGMSVTITPHKSDSAILLIATYQATSSSSTDDTVARFAITDSSDNAISGAELDTHGSQNISGAGNRIFATNMTSIAYATPATTSAVTYKLRFRSLVATTTTQVNNNGSTGQMFAIEVSA